MSDLITNTATASVVTLLVNQGFQEVQARRESDGSDTIFANGKKIGNIPPFRVEPYGFMNFIPGFISVGTSETKRPEEPQIRITNPFPESSIRVLNQSFIFGSAFKTDGVFEMLVNGRVFIPHQAVGTYKQVDNMGVPITSNGLVLKNGQDIEIRAWSPNGVAVEMTSSTLIGEYLSTPASEAGGELA